MYPYLHNNMVIVLGVFLCGEESRHVVDLLKVEAPQPVDFLYCVDGNVALQEPGQLVDAGLRVEVPG